MVCHGVEWLIQRITQTEMFVLSGSGAASPARWLTPHLPAILDTMACRG